MSNFNSILSLVVCHTDCTIYTLPRYYTPALFQISELPNVRITIASTNLDYRKTHYTKSCSYLFTLTFLHPAPTPT